MFEISSSKESTRKSVDSNPIFGTPFGEQIGEVDWYDYHGELEPEESTVKESPCEKCISVGDYLPYGCRLFYGTGEMLRLRELGERRRILLLGVIGSFTPHCWNRHLFRVIRKARYYAERGIDYICCISTNDTHTHTAWGSQLGCEDKIFMLSDVSKTFTRSIGMDIVVPWLDNNIRSRRYVIYAENMEVTKMIMANDDEPEVNWNCEHLQPEIPKEEIESEESDVDLWI